MREIDTDIVIVGGGPVGLYLAGRLLQEGISCRILEKRTSIDKHSKSLGIHPVSLELFDKAGIVNSFLKDGLKITKGISFWNTQKLGEISFDYCPPPFPFILAIPQWITENILENWVKKLDSDALIRGAEVIDFSKDKESVDINYQSKNQTKSVRCRFLVGCDGKNSSVRTSAGIKFNGEAYPDFYIMGDFEDTTQFESDAAVFLHSDGLIESFPLPQGQRRWVVKTDEYIDNPSPEELASVVQERVQYNLYDSLNSMISSFGVQQYSAEKYAAQNILLAGDAAHIVSPIGGQGMNLGWLDAEEASSVLVKVLENPSEQNQLFSEYSDQRKRIARQVAKRAEMNMHLGRKEASNLPYKMLLTLALKTRISRLLAKIFTMRGLGSWWI